jgi:hypothetical protein
MNIGGECAFENVNRYILPPVSCLSRVSVHTSEYDLAILQLIKANVHLCLLIIWVLHKSSRNYRSHSSMTRRFVLLAELGISHTADLFTNELNNLLNDNITICFMQTT